MIFRTALLIMLNLVVATTAFSFNYRDLRTAPIAWFNDKDIEMMTETFNKAMESNADGQSSEWRNDQTGHHGSITPLSTSRKDPVTCRRVRIENHAGSNNAVTRLNFCRKGAEPWQVSE